MLRLIAVALTDRLRSISLSSFSDSAPNRDAALQARICGDPDFQIFVSDLVSYWLYGAHLCTLLQILQSFLVLDVAWCDSRRGETVTTFVEPWL